MATSHYNYGLSQDVPGLGDVAKFGTAPCSGQTCASISAIQLRGGTIADLLVTVKDPSGAEAPVLALAQALLAAVSN